MKFVYHGTSAHLSAYNALIEQPLLFGEKTAIKTAVFTVMYGGKPAHAGDTLSTGHFGHVTGDLIGDLRSDAVTEEITQKQIDSWHAAVSKSPATTPKSLSAGEIFSFSHGNGAGKTVYLQDVWHHFANVSLSRQCSNPPSAGHCPK